MTKEKSKTKQKKTTKKSKEEQTAVSVSPKKQQVAESAKKASLLPNSISKPISDLKSRVEALEKVVAKLSSVIESNNS
jgi:uncharacterized protein YceH (UPF0502 family)